MEIKHDEGKHRFDIFDSAGVHMGEIVYKPGGGDELRATHTEVFAPYEGQGVAGKLLDALVAYAVKNNKKIVPVCSYVVRAFAKNPDKYRAVLR